MMKHSRACALFVAAMLVAASGYAQNTQQFHRRPARTFRGEVNRPLTPPSTAAPAAIVAQFLRGRGVNVTAASLVNTGNAAAQNGTTVVQLEQRVAGVRVYGTYAKASISARGELVHLIENLVSAPAGSLAAPRGAEAQALNAALRQLYPGEAVATSLLRRDGDTVVFARTAFFHTEPTVTRVVFPTADGSLRAGLLVETWSEQQNLLHETLVGGNGEVVFVELRTNSDSYNVFPVSPGETAQTVLL